MSPLEALMQTRKNLEYQRVEPQGTFPERVNALAALLSGAMSPPPSEEAVSADMARQIAAMRMQSSVRK